MRPPLSALDVVQRPLQWSECASTPSGDHSPRSPKPASQPTEEEVALDELYRASGGLIMASDVLSMLRLVTEQPLSLLARWIVDDEVIHFAWRAQTFFPLGQFDMHTMQVWTTWRQARHCLPADMGQWEVARWFAEPNPLLGGTSPSQALRLESRRVDDVARRAVPLRVSPSARQTR